MQPDQPLAGFDGAGVGGVWTLEIQTNITGDPNAPNQGVLEQWCLTITP